MESEQKSTCKKCQNEIVDSYCSNCGTPKSLPRIDGKYILSQIGGILNFDRGILYTIRELLLRPGASVQQFIAEDRNRLVKPILFLIISSLIYTLAQQFLQFEDGYVNYQGDAESITLKMFAWVQQNYGYANLIMAVFIALWIKILFRKYDYNFFEILILLCFVMGMGMLIYALVGVIDSFVPAQILNVGGILGFLYAAWGIGQFFDNRKKMNYLKGFFAYFLGFLTFSIVIVVIGGVLDVIIN